VPPSEQALSDAMRFFEITVDVDEQVRWLRELVKAVPQVEDYRWALVRALLDHEGAAEAAKLMDERLKNDGSDLSAIVLLRCEADLRGSDSTSAVKRLLRLLEVQNSTDVEKQVLVFAQTRALDVVIEKILRARVARDPQKAEAVFELAAFFRSRRDVAAEDKLLREFTSAAGTEEERQKRLSDASALTHMELQRDLPAQTALRTYDLKAAQMVRRGQLVMVSSGEGKGFLITLRAEAQQDGILGEQIRLKNSDSGRLISGVVTGPNTLKGL
jgi:flagella basal body P-ring formation protein FlgA